MRPTLLNYVIPGKAPGISLECFDIRKNIEEVIERLVAPLIEEIGYEYVGTEIKKTTDSKELIIYADKEGGIGLDDCEKISKLIEPAIDACDPIEDAYFLCVSSPGLDRALKTARDYQRSLGKFIDIKLYKQLDGAKEFTGKLLHYDDDGFIAEIKNEEKQFSYKDTAVVKMHVDI